MEQFLRENLKKAFFSVSIFLSVFNAFCHTAGSAQSTIPQGQKVSLAQASSSHAKSVLSLNFEKNGKNEVSGQPATSATLPTPFASDKIVLRITTTGGTPSVTVADLMYNKPTAFNFEIDDSKRQAYDLIYKYLHGGEITEADGRVVTYPGKFFTDGCGNLVPCQATAAVFMLGADKETEVLDDNLNNNYIKWWQLAEMIQNGFGVSNHGYGGTAEEQADRLSQIHKTDELIYRRLKEHGVEFVPNTLVVPNADEGYTVSSFNLGYLAVSSQFGVNSRDGYPSTGWSFAIPLANMHPTTPTLTRAFAKDDLRDFNKWMQPGESLDLFCANARSAKPTKSYVRTFSHGPNVSQVLADGTTSFDTFKRAIDFLLENGGDNIWISSTQDFAEYRHVRRLVEKTQVINGNTVEITLDYKNVPERVRNRSLSLVLSGTSIANLEVDGADRFTFNPQTGLINIFKVKTSGFADPANDVLPPRIVKLEAYDEYVTITYDKPTEQSLPKAYTVGTEAATAITGSGTQWILTLPSKWDSTKTFSYRAQNGDARWSQNENYRTTSYINLSVARGVETPLPVSWLSFEGKAVNGGCELTWSTASEVNTAYFGIERSLNGKEFAEIGQVTAAGNSSQVQQYRFLDKRLVQTPTVVYYRLKQVDLDGKWEHSKIIAVSQQEQQNRSRLTVYPNPFGRKLTLQFDTTMMGKNGYVSLLTAEGREVYHRDIPGFQGAGEVMLEVPELASGVYLLKVMLDGEVEIQKILRQ